MTNFASRYASKALKNLCLQCGCRVAVPPMVTCLECLTPRNKPSVLDNGDEVHSILSVMKRGRKQKRTVFRSTKNSMNGLTRIKSPPKRVMTPTPRDHWLRDGRTIYCLSVCGWPFYVGSTIRPLSVRLAGHVSKAVSKSEAKRNNRPRRGARPSDMISALIFRGDLSALTIEPLKTLPLTSSVEDLRREELEAIRTLAESGLHLFQYQGNRP